MRAIIEQYGDSYNVQSFSGSELLIGKNDSLDAISLGQENAEATKAIAQYDKQIAEIDKELLPPEKSDGKSLNLCEQHNLAIKDIKELLSKRTHFYQRAAHDLKHQYTTIYGPNYYKNRFEEDIPYAQNLTEDEVKDANETLSAQTHELSNVAPPELPKLPNLSKLKDAVNDILSATVQSRTVMEEFINKPEKQNFAYEGMQIHSRKADERCAFCGSPIKQERWDQLDNYFSDEVEKLQKRITKGLELIEDVRSRVKEPFIFPQKSWQTKFQEKQVSLQLVSNKQRLIIINFLEQLEQALVGKREAPFKKNSPLRMEVPENLIEIQKSLIDLWQDNITYNQQLAEQKEASKLKLKYYYVYQQLMSGNHDGLLKDIANANEKKKFLDNQMLKVQESRNKLLALKADEIKKSTSETQAATEINRLVLNLGDDSFSLQPIEQLGQQRGLYKIMGRDNKPRSLKTLSTGELNLLAFLWFRYHLDDVSEDDTRPRIVIFDDPVNSNDDNSQYLILEEIKDLIFNNQTDQFFVLTHNNHFYVQIRPQSYGKNGIFHLRRASKTYVIRIVNPNDDLKSIYEDLWAELHFLYDHRRLVSSWNCMRRILETYGRFNFANKYARDTIRELSTSTDQVLYLSLLKSLHVNSHMGTDTDLDLSGRDIETLLHSFYDVFVSLGATKHFVTYWGEDLA